MAKRFPADPNSDLKKAAEDYHDAMREVVTPIPGRSRRRHAFRRVRDESASLGIVAPGRHAHRRHRRNREHPRSRVIKRDPNHLGAIHYYIHAVEASHNPERALSAANRLAALAPGAGHIVHMPAHIYIRTGDYEAAVKPTRQAAAVDRAYIKASRARRAFIP